MLWVFYYHHKILDLVLEFLRPNLDSHKIFLAWLETISSNVPSLAYQNDFPTGQTSKRMFHHSPLQGMEQLEFHSH